MARQKFNEILEKNGITDKDIRDFLFMIYDNSLNDKNEKDVKMKIVKDFFSAGFEINDPTMTKKISSQVIQQCMWRVMSKIKLSNYMIHGTGKDSDTERVTTEGVATVMERGGLISALSGKAGSFWNAFMRGDGYIMMGKGDNRDNPLDYIVIRGEDVYYDDFSYGIRGNKPATKTAVIFAYHKDEAYSLWPELEKNDVWGRIPGTYQEEDHDEREDMDVVEVCWAFNKAKKKHVIFAGTQCYEIDSFEKDEYPNIKRGKAYIPIYQFICMPSDGKFYNYGIGELVYNLAVITQKLMNMEIGHLEENTYPITLINAPQNKVDELVEKMAMANEARANGGKPFVAMEFGATPNSAQSQALLTQNLFNEWNVMWDRLYREFSRLGINLDDIERGSGITRGQVIAEEQASNAFVMQMMEYNRDTVKELVEDCMQGIVENVSPKNKSILNLLTKISLPQGGLQKIENEITLGILKNTLANGNWFVVVDSRTGARTSDLMQTIYLERQLAMTQPGTPEYQELYKQMAQVRGIEIGQPEMPIPPPQGPQGQGPQAAGQPIPAETQRVLPEMMGNDLIPV